MELESTLKVLKRECVGTRSRHLERFASLSTETRGFEPREGLPKLRHEWIQQRARVGWAVFFGRRAGLRQLDAFCRVSAGFLRFTIYMVTQREANNRIYILQLGVT